MVVAFLTAKVATRTLACLRMPCLAYNHFQSIYIHQRMTTGACDMQGEVLDFPGLSAELFQLHAHLQPQLTQEELNTAVQHYSAKVEAWSEHMTCTASGAFSMVSGCCFVLLLGAVSCTIHLIIVALLMRCSSAKHWRGTPDMLRFSSPAKF